MLTKELVFERTKYVIPFDPNPVQQAAFNHIFYTENNILVTAATGTGKSLIYEWAMYKALCEGFHVIKIAPMKSLVEQKKEDWLKKGHPLSKWEVVMKTGDYTDVSAKDLKKPIKIMTPEAFAVCLRKAKASWMDKVRLLVVDEIHTLGQKTRGNSLEVAIMQFFGSVPKSRIVGVSATVDDKSANEIRSWLTALSKKQTAFVQGKNWRPRPLHQHFHPYKMAGRWSVQQNIIRKDVVLLTQRILDETDKVLIFVHAKTMGRALKKLFLEQHYVCDFHSSDLKMSQRKKIEDDFAGGELPVLISTSTLAVGMDFPVEHVIIVDVYRGSHEVEIDTLQQMRGRAGHQRGCKEGHVHYLIPEDEERQWVKKIEQEYEVHSELQDEFWMTFHAVAVINKKRMATEDELKDWWGNTLAYHQLKKAPLIDGVIRELIKCEAVEEINEGMYTSTNLGKAASYFYFHPIELYNLFNKMRELSPLMQELTVKMKLTGKNDIEMRYLLCCRILAEVRTLVCMLPGGYKQEDDEKNDIIYLLRSLGVTRTGFDEHMVLCILFFKLIRFSGDKFPQREMNIDNKVHHCLWGIFKELKRLSACIQYLEKDYEDLDEVLRWTKRTVVKIIYGLSEDTLGLVRLKHVGRSRAIKMSQNGITSISDVVAMSDSVIRLFGLKIGTEIIDHAQEICVAYDTGKA